MLKLLKFIEGANVGIFIAQVYDKPQRDFVIFDMVEEAAASSGIARTYHRIARGMHDQPLLMILSGDFPYFFEADTVVLRIAVFVERVFGNDLLA